MTFRNDAGLANRNHYGPREIDEIFGGEQTTSGGLHTLEWVFDWDDLPAVDAAGLDMEIFVPQGAVITFARFQTITGFVAGTSYDIGLEEKDGTDIDADGLFDALLQAAISAENEWADHSDYTGALIDATVGLAENGYLLIAETGTFTAGRGKVIVEYRQADFDASNRYTAGGVKA